MAKVSPSILSADFANLERDLRAIARSGADYIHVDVMDGQFVPNITIGMPVVRAIAQVAELPLDVHLMIDRPVRYVEAFCKAGASMVCVHVESDTPEQIRAALLRIRACGCRPGLSLKPGTPAEAVLPYLELCSMLLVMTVEPGFSGQAFLPDTMPKLAFLRRWIDTQKLHCMLEVDGGVHSRPAWTTAPTFWSPAPLFFKRRIRPPSCAGSKATPPGNSPSRRQIKHLPPCLGHRRIPGLRRLPSQAAQ